jgi:TonB family protein
LIARRQELQQLFSYNETGITNTEALANYTQWFAKVTEFLGNDWDGKNATEVSISAPYPPEACFRQLRGIAIVGVVTNPEGQVLDDPAPILLRSSGYQFFNLRALEIVKSHEFEATRKKKAYQVSVEFTPNSQRCSNMSSPSPSSPSSPDGSG